MTESESERLSYAIEKSATADGVAIPAGKYAGRRVRLGMKHMGKTEWAAWEYKIDYDVYGDLDCTKAVKDGEIKVT